MKKGKATMARKGRKNNALQKKLKKARLRLRLFKLKLFLLITLPITITAITHAVIKEYARAKREAKAKA